MDVFQLVALLLTLSALFSYLNHRWVRLPTTIGLMVIALLFSLGLIVLGIFAPAMEQKAENVIAQIDFSETVMHGMLGFLLFAGALHVDLQLLAQQRAMIFSLATVGVVLSAVGVGLMAWLVFTVVGVPMPLIYCLLFGTIIAPTDPIAVLGILRQANAPKDLELKITGESLFNDGVAVVMFLGLLEIATDRHPFDIGHLTAMFFQEAVGGAIFGLVIGAIAFYLLRGVNNYQVEILISLAVVAGGYALAGAWHLSGPIAMVVAGLVIGNHGRLWAMSRSTREHLDSFWELVDEILNAVLFVLIGLEVLLLTFTGGLLFAGLLMIPIVLAIRFVSVSLPLRFLRRWKTFHPHAAKILTWGGLRGGVSVALALAIPPQFASGNSLPYRETILTVTYIVVVFSIIVQGLTIGPYIRRILDKDAGNLEPGELAPEN